MDINALIAYTRNLAEEEFSDDNQEGDKQFVLDTNTGTNDKYRHYIGAIVNYDKYGYGIGYIKAISGDRVRIKFSNIGGEPFEKEFLLSALNNAIEIIKFEDIQ